VLLVHPEISRTRYNFVGVIENECLELEYIIPALKEAGCETKIWDGQVEKKSVKSLIKSFEPDFLYVCGRTRQENFMLEYCRAAKSINERIVTMVGGIHASLCPDRLFLEGVDYVFTSYNVFNIVSVMEIELLKEQGIARLETEKKLEKVEGLYYRLGDKSKHNKAVPFDIKKLPRPDREYFYDRPDNYRYLELRHAAWVRTAFSCPFRCKFCERNRMNQGVYSKRDIEDVVDEIESIKSDNIYIVDDDFLYDSERLKQFVALLRKRRIKKKYICYGRADFIANNEQIMAELKSVGLYYVLVGLEAVSDDYLMAYDKRSGVKINEKSVRICNELGINIMGMFILDLHFKKKDFRNIYKWAKVNKLRHVALSIFTPEMNLPTYKEYSDRIITNNPSHFDYLHLVAEPFNMSVRRYYFNYYVLLIKLFLRAKRDGIYDFIDYGDYIRSFLANMVRKRKNDDK